MPDITKETMQFIQSTASVEEFDINGLHYTNKALHLIEPPADVASPLKTQTLTSLVALYSSNFEGIKDKHPVFHVQNERKVSVFRNETDAYGRRDQFAVAELSENIVFQFGTFLSQEQFIIGLQAQFLAYGDRDEVLKIVSNLATEEKLEVNDNGITQTVTAKTGAVLVHEIVLKPRVLLKPYRTFREAAQPPSEFVLRVRKGQNGAPVVALFEADGGIWKLEAMANVAEYLQSKLEGVTVIY